MEDALGVGKQDVTHGDGGLEVFVQADGRGDEVAGFHHAEDGENHGHAEADESHAAHGGNHLVSPGAVDAELTGLKEGVEAVALLLGEAEAERVGDVLEVVVEDVVFPAEGGEMGVEHEFFVLREDVLPLELGLQDVEDEAGEKAVLGVRNEAHDLLGRAHEGGGELGLIDLNVLVVLAAVVRDGLVVKGLAEAVGEVAVVGDEGVGEGVALGLEDEAAAVVVAQHLVHAGGGDVGREEDLQERGLLGLDQRGVGLVVLVLAHLHLVDFLLLAVLALQFFIDILDQEAAVREAALAGGGPGGEEEVEVGIDLGAVVVAVDVGHDGGEGDDGTDEEGVALFGGLGNGDDALQEVRETGVNLIGEGGQLLGLGGVFRGLEMRVLRSGFRVFGGVCGIGVDVNPGVLGELEEGGDVDTLAVGAQAAGVLLVGLFGGVARVEPAHAVVEFAAGFPEGLADGEADVEPVVVGGGDIDLALFDATNDGFDVGVGVGAVFGGVGEALACPLLRVELLIRHGYSA